ncbi:transport system permease protein [Candidatus Vecturithrix granuli]|uniref:Transport system permease protein n=1 Tax=Vecturithrix granuli TaxID=1499967 RepID=A0A081C522_VECG1|nr:transport system permease protein [Candidatus Vecturithrix granuli]
MFMYSDKINMLQRQEGVGISLYAGLVLMLLTMFVLDISVGSVHIPFGQIVKIFAGQEPQRAAWGNILWLFRLPKALTAILAGAGLAVSGLVMQTLFRNPLAGPSVLGINAGASLGVALMVLSAAAGGVGSRFLDGLGVLGELGMVLAASLGSALVLLLIMAFAERVRSIMTLLILGLLFGYATSALVSILIHFSIAERIQAYISWTFGSFGTTTWKQLYIFAPVITGGLLAASFLQKPLNALLLGEVYAKSLGLHLKHTRLSLIAITALLSGSTTAFCGPVAFLGITIPHLCRIFFHTSDHRTLLPTVILTGAIVALIADIISQMPGSQLVLPLNAVTSLIGVPVIIWVILSKNDLMETFAA